MSWSNVKLVFLRELRDQLRDRRTLFTIFVLPLMLYPLLGMSVFQVQQFLKEHASEIRVVGAASLPGEPPLVVDNQFAEPLCSAYERRLLQLDLVADNDKTAEDLHQDAERDIKLGLYDAVVYFPPDFAERIARVQRGGESTRAAGDAASGQATEGKESLEPQIFYNTASDKSRVAADRVEGILRRWRESLVEENLRQSNLPAATARPFELVSTDVSEDVRRRAAIWSKILPFVLLVWALTGAFYPAIDLCAGEKERGTLETLLSSPAERSEIVWGKLLTVMTFSMGTSLLNLTSMTVTGTFIISQLQKMGVQSPRLDIGPPPLDALVWLVLALIPISALFSALSLAIAAFARSSKEGQYYLMPLLMISLPLMMLPMLPAAELDLGFALIPISGLMLLLRVLIEGQYWEALRYSIPVIGVTAGCCLLAIRWAIDQFNNESVLFRESERIDLGLWLRHLVRDREDVPTVGEAVFCGLLLLVIRFFSSLAATMPKGWNDFATNTLILQVALIATPTCLMAIILTRRPLKTLLINRPSFLATLPAAALLALLLHPTMLWLGEAIRQLYPISPEALDQLKPIEGMFATAPLWQVLLLIGLVPAVCEELAFRGFILSGLRRIGHKWGAIVLTSVFFGLAHGILQQSLSACLVGIVIGYIAVKTGSLFPGILYHLVHNSLSVLLGRVTPEALDAQPWLRAIYVTSEGGEYMVYQWPVALGASVLAVFVLLWLRSLPYHASAEEKLQEALDNETPGLPAKATA